METRDIHNLQRHSSILYGADKIKQSIECESKVHRLYSTIFGIMIRVNVNWILKQIYIYIYDIQVRGANMDHKMIQMAKSFPNSRHYLTYKHSLRSYASILYLRLPPGFRIILRGEDVQHHNLVNDLMYTQEVTYKPQGAADINHKENNMIVVTIGFVKDAKKNIDVQGFNVYHKNRLIKPFWRIQNLAGSEGRGVIGILEAYFIAPAHDKQGFERTTVMARLESRLIGMHKKYWVTNCHVVGYAPRNKQKPEKDSPLATKETKSTEVLKPSP